MKGKSTNPTSITGHFVWIGIGLAVLFWILESAVHVFVFHEGTFVQQLSRPALHEIWMRFAVVAMFVLFSIYAQTIVSQRKRVEEALREAHEELERRVEERTAELAKANEQLMREIEERKLAEASLKLKDSAIASSIGAIAISDLEGNITYVNDSFLKMLGYDGPDEVLGKPASQFWEKKEEVLKIFEIMRHEGNFIGESVARKKDGSPFDIQLTANMVRDESGKQICTMASFIDITDLKNAEKALEESEAQFRDLVEGALVGVLIFQDDRVVYQNPEQERLFGPVPSGFEFKSFLDNIHPEDVENVRQFYQAMVSGFEQPIEIEMRFYPIGMMGSRRHIRWVHCRSSMFMFQGKEAILMNMVDITRSKQLEQLVVIREKMASLGHVAAGIAHEIRNPLSGINLYLDTIRESLEDPENIVNINELVSDAKDAANKIETVIKRVLDFSRPSKPQLVLEDINEPIREALKLSSVSLRKSGIKTALDLADDLPDVYVDRQMIEQVILNLINNSSEALKVDVQGTKTIRITSEKAEDHITVDVSDSGPGVPHDIRDRIFDPFYTTSDHGSGIGLGLCQRIIADHGGTIEASSADLGGAKITIRIPTDKRRFHR